MADDFDNFDRFDDFDNFDGFDDSDDLNDLDDLDHWSKLSGPYMNYQPSSLSDCNNWALIF